MRIFFILLAITTIVNSIDEKMANENVNSFDNVDKDHNAKIDQNEFNRWMNGRGLSIQRINAIFSQYDVDRDSYLNLAEFVPVAYAFSQKPIDTEETIFKRIDVNGDGVIDQIEQTFLRSNGNGRILDGILAVADMNRDGNLAYTEFVNALSLSKPNTQDRINLENAQSIMSYVDSNRDLRLQPSEIKLFASKYARELSEDELNHLFEVFDLNKDRVLDISELSQFPEKLSNLLHLSPPPSIQ